MPWALTTVAGRTATKYYPSTLTAKTVGKEGLIVLGFSQAVTDQPDLSAVMTHM